MEHGELVSEYRCYSERVSRGLYHAEVCMTVRMLHSCLDQSHARVLGGKLYWKNRAIRRLKFVGTVIGVKYMWLKGDDYAVIHLDDSSDSSILKCKCEVNQLNSFGININAGFIGSRVEVCGVYNTEFNELEVGFIGVLPSTLFSEIEHWRKCCLLLRMPDDLTDEELKASGIGDDEMQDGRDSPLDEYFSTPPQNKAQFIEKLVLRDVKDKLEITSPDPVRNESISVVDDTCDNTTLGSNTIDLRTAIEPITQPEVSGNDNFYKPGTGSTSKRKLYRKLFIAIYLIPEEECTIDDLARDIGITSVLNGFLDGQGHISNDDMQIILQEYLSQLITGDVLVITARNRVSLKKLHALKAYTHKRINLLLKIQALLGTVRYQDVLQSTSMAIPAETIIDAFKESLRTIDAGVAWFIETHQHSFTIHFTYSQSTQTCNN
ncbi:uncharacterized protein CGFF_00047 [Nakaseomyces glabratus]|nr:Telomere regulation protein Stn1 [Nakaseomyces glabratus]QNG15826.1 uncharacterized protein GWK60_K09823 [Nakaseomyces glabratus]SCV12490.1 uncharacterized protein CGFF_00047 [Nakaseomyces glabratus]SLM10035.1 uncharacterized protein CGFF_00047 [Nakaseomyces glabratus]